MQDHQLSQTLYITYIHWRANESSPVDQLGKCIPNPTITHTKGVAHSPSLARSNGAIGPNGELYGAGPHRDRVSALVLFFPTFSDLHSACICKRRYSTELWLPSLPCLFEDTVMSYMHCVAHYPYLGGVDESFRGVVKYGYADPDRSREITAGVLN
jgi:hypothetical protein